jgi:hypothetical protein
MAMVEVTKIGPIDRGAWKNTRRDRRQHMARVGEWVRIGQMHRHDFVATSGVGDNAIGATDLVRELGDAVEFGVALHLNANEHEVVGGKDGRGATFIDAVTMSLTAIFDDESNDLTREIHMAAGLFDVVEDRWTGIKKGCRSSGAGSIDSEIERKLEFAAHSGDATNDVSAINGTAIPGVSRNHRSFDPNQRGTTVRAGDSDGLVQVSEEAFDADGFVIAAGSGMEADAEEFARRSEDAAKSATSVDNDEATHADFQQNLLE